MPLFLLLEAGVYIYDNPLSPLGGGGISADVIWEKNIKIVIWEKNIKRKREKGGKSKRKRKKGERKRENVKLKGKINAK
jgi:hypothetical protein